MRFNQLDHDSVLYFAYGHLTNSEHMLALAPQARCRGRAFLPNHRLILHKFADIVKDVDSGVYGVLWELNHKDEQAIDDHEAVGKNYEPEHVRVESKEGPVRARVYKMTVTPHLHEPPTKHYVARIVKGYLEHNIPLNQIRQAVANIREA